MHTQYPELKDYKLFVKLLPPGSTTLGYFDEANKTLVVPIINGDANYDLESVLIHEPQHFIQRIEGFERGSNPQAAGGFLNYLRTSGEVEARNAQKRRHMKPDERCKSLWSDTVEPEHKNAETHLYPTKDASRKQHQQDLDKKKQAHRSREAAPASPTSSPTTQETENAKAKRKRKQMQQALAIEIELQLTKGKNNPAGQPKPVEWIYLRIDYLDPDFDKARRSFPKRVVFGDFFAEGEQRGAEYLWAKTTHDEAAKILPNYKKYIDTPGRWDIESLRNL